MPEPNIGNEPRPSLADAINAVMSDPSIIKGALEALKKSGLTEPHIKEEPPSPTEGADQEAAEARASQPVSQDTGELISALSPMLSLLSPQPSHPQRSSEDGDRRSALLVALRPYLSESRREAIDYIIKISQVTDLIKKAGR